MNILMISSLTSQSGSAVRFWDICLELSKRGHRVYFIERAPISDRKNAKNVTFLRTPVIKWSLPLDILIATIFNFICSLFFSVDIVFVLKPLPNSCIPALFKKLCGAKIILDIDDVDFEYYAKGFFRKIVSLFYKIFPCYFNMITVHTKALKNFVVKELAIQEKKVFFLPQGIDYNIFAQTQRDAQLRQNLGLNGHKVLVIAASLGITTNLKHTFEVLQQLLSGISNIKLLVIGGGSHLDKYQKMTDNMGIRENVVFTDYIPHSQVSKYIALGDVALNYYEPNKANKYRASIKVREYLALGIPVVCNLEGDTHLFSEYVWIFNSLDEYREQIIAALNNGDNPKVKQGQAFISQNYDWKTIAMDFEKTLLKLI